MNPLTAIDFYKADHRNQYPKGTELVYSNFTPRSDKFSNIPEKYRDGVVFFGLQNFILEYLGDSWRNNFFNQPKHYVLKKYKRRMQNALGMKDFDISHIESLHDLGYLPIEIRAFSEGTVTPIGVPMLTIKNTIPEFFWITNYLESVLSNMLWKMCTSATTARYYRRLCEEYAEKTCSNKDHIPFQCHDFSFRGMGGYHDGAMSAAAHLLSFAGTDTVQAIDLLEKNYNADSDKELVGASVSATEHSVMCMGTMESEIDTFKTLINKTYPTGIVSIVSDTWDFWKVINEYLPVLKDDIMKRNGKTVCRPDSGSPVDIICGNVIIEDLSYNPSFDGYRLAKMNNTGATLEDCIKQWTEDLIIDHIVSETPHGEVGVEFGEKFILYNNIYYKIKTFPEWNRYDKQYYFVDGVNNTTIEAIELSSEQKGAVECLWEIFGGTINDKGYKELDSHIGLIYGDSITPERAKEILYRLEQKGFASSNIVFGVGSFTYTFVTRDTYGFAVKATAGIVDGEVRQIFKDPKTDDGTKKSLKGFLGVYKNDKNSFNVVDNLDKEPYDDALIIVYKDGDLIRNHSLSEIRERITKGL